MWKQRIHNEDSKPEMWFSGRCLKAAFTGLVVGFLFSFLLSRSVWLEMRVNIGYVIPISVAVSLLFFTLTRRSITLVSFLFLELFTVFLFFSIYGFSFSTILIVPAALFRDGFHLSSLSLPRISLFLLCSLGGANAAWVCAAAMLRRRNGENYYPATDS
jgi:hypothetical protein